MNQGLFVGVSAGGVSLDPQKVQAVIQLEKELGSDVHLLIDAHTDFDEWGATAGLEWRF